MRLDASLAVTSLADIPAAAHGAETLGLDTLWTSETQVDPFLPMALAAEHTARVRLGTAVAIAFARSPTAVAHTAWDLAAASGGRFILGLGTQVKAHITRRFGMPWAPPVPRLREYVQAVRAVWHTWQTGERLNFRGEHYQLTLMTPFFTPQPLRVPPPPIYLAGVGAPLCRLVGEIADGFLMHPLHSAKYLAEVVLPAIEAGAATAGRTRGDVKLVVPVFFIPSGDPGADFPIRAQIAFYASTPSYRGVLAIHGWERAAETLSHMAARGQWLEMTTQVTDEMLEVFALTGAWADLPAMLRAKYAGLADDAHVMLYMPFTPGRLETELRGLADGLRSGA